MATKPTVGGSDGTWGTELNDHLDVSLDADGKVDDGAEQTTSAAPGADAELANKKYADDLMATEVAARSFGVYTNQDSDNNAMLASHAYLANQDGTVTATVSSTANDQTLRGFVDTDTDPASGGDLLGANASYGTNKNYSITFPVASGKYFEILTSMGGTLVIRWHPVGTLIKPTDQD